MSGRGGKNERKHAVGHGPEIAVIVVVDVMVAGLEVETDDDLVVVIVRGEEVDLETDEGPDHLQDVGQGKGVGHGIDVLQIEAGAAGLERADEILDEAVLLVGIDIQTDRVIEVGIKVKRGVRMEVVLGVGKRHKTLTQVGQFFIKLPEI